MTTYSLTTHSGKSVNRACNLNQFVTIALYTVCSFTIRRNNAAPRPI